MFNKGKVVQEVIDILLWGIKRTNLFGGSQASLIMKSWLKFWNQPTYKSTNFFIVSKNRASVVFLLSNPRATRSVSHKKCISYRVTYLETVLVLSDYV